MRLPALICELKRRGIPFTARTRKSALQILLLDKLKADGDLITQGQSLKSSVRMHFDNKHKIAATEVTSDPSIMHSRKQRQPKKSKPVRHPSASQLQASRSPTKMTPTKGKLLVRKLVYRLIFYVLYSFETCRGQC